ncbi:glycosyltransferase WbuB [Agitococcus lubricus]|uniref:Colanic acid biosynthesis glycosyl transferase WcaI n=1 Tax=Agitococcus lubricus TaxID=1077255 RepID=A0A2T5J0A3_9GAMM|nr:glycosyltransferase WbuB [Agitococcus lubricus]PTQ89773.1 colanic acid biosynthesis glycosyl transferase WcaI [Agitococcus lubricus]
MKFLLYGINYKPELTGIGKYSGEMAEWLAAQGDDVRVVTAPPYYPAWRIEKNYRNWYQTSQDNGVTVHRCPLYVPSEPTTITRLLHLISFALSSFLVLLRLLLWRPHVVFVVEPTLFCLPLAWLYARLVGAKLILHIQDYEIDAMFGLGMMTTGRIGRIAKAIESWLMRRCDIVSTISNSMIKIAEAKGVNPQKTLYFPNWVDTEFISPKADKYHFRHLWGIAAHQKVVLYSGNMGKKQGLEIVIDAAEQLRHRTDITFLLVGQGAAKAELEALVQQKNLSNVSFAPLQPYEDLPKLLAMPDVHLIVQKKGAADVVLPSKMTGILSVGGYSLITAEPHTELGLIIEKHSGIAQRVEPEDLSAFIEGLMRVLEKDTHQTNHIARDYAEQYLNKKAVLMRFRDSILVV